jgi:hypothetical protein
LSTKKDEASGGQGAGSGPGAGDETGIQSMEPMGLSWNEEVTRAKIQIINERHTTEDLLMAYSSLMITNPWTTLEWKLVDSLNYFMGDLETMTPQQLMPLLDNLQSFKKMDSPINEQFWTDLINLIDSEIVLTRNPSFKKNAETNIKRKLKGKQEKDYLEVLSYVEKKIQKLSTEREREQDKAPYILMLHKLTGDLIYNRLQVQHKTLVASRMNQVEVKSGAYREGERKTRGSVYRRAPRPETGAQAIGRVEGGGQGSPNPGAEEGMVPPVAKPRTNKGGNILGKDTSDIN